MPALLRGRLRLRLPIWMTMRLSASTPCRCRTPSSHHVPHAGLQCRASAASVSPQALSRRQAALDLAALVVGQALLPQEAEAIRLPSIPGFDSQALPEAAPALIPRKSLRQNFAVLLLRSVYEAADDLDFMPMDEYQMRFWKLRQGAYESYLQACKPLSVRQGDLTDPLYFDFISFCQSATLRQEMQKGKQTFQEYCAECEDTGRLKTVARSTELRDNAILPPTLQARAGDMIYASLRSGFRGETFNAPEPCPAGATLPELVSCVQGLLDVFVANGFAIKGNVQAVEPLRGEHGVHWHGAGAGGGSFRVHLQSPANLYGLSRLEKQGGVATAFDAITIGALLRASGCDASFKVHRNEASIIEEWDVVA